MPSAHPSRFASSTRLQIDDLREQRQAWRDWQEYERDQERYRREEWPGYRTYDVPRGVFELDVTDE